MSTSNFFESPSYSWKPLKIFCIDDIIKNEKWSLQTQLNPWKPIMRAFLVCLVCLFIYNKKILFFHSIMHYIQYAIPDLVLIIKNTEDGPGDYYKLFLFSMYLLLFYIFEYISNLTQWSSLYQPSLLKPS